MLAGLEAQVIGPYVADPEHEGDLCAQLPALAATAAPAAPTGAAPPGK